MDFDGVVIGAGHNGLTLAAYLSRGEARPAYKRAFDAQLAVYIGISPTG